VASASQSPFSFSIGLAPIIHVVHFIDVNIAETAFGQLFRQGFPPVDPI